jgi:hypothetical protein
VLDLSHMTRSKAVVAGVLIAIAFCTTTILHLDAQGAYYDELHQAPAAFHYVGKHPVLFTRMFFGRPTFNMTYSGAIKSTIYGLFLRYVHPHFTVYSWRLFGILFVAAGLACFYSIAGPSLATATVACFAALLLTDITLIILTRHDWAPVALALALRLVFLGVWLSIELQRDAVYKYAIAGLLVGVAVFEKLSSVVLLVPLLILLLRSRWRRSAWIAAIAGLLLGLMPLLRANTHTYRTTGAFISLSDTVQRDHPIQIDEVLSYAYQYLSLGAGELARNNLMDEPTKPFFVIAEVALTIILLLIVGAAMLQLPKDRSMRIAGVMAATYLLISVAVFLLPHPTYFHHWIIGTPFQYCAFALALPVLNTMSRQRIPHAATYRFVFALSLVVLVAVRVPNVALMERSLVSGKASPGFSPAFNRLVEVASAKKESSFFIAADWGTANQIYCGSDGSDDIVGEPLGNADPVQAALDMAARTKKPVLYVVRSGLPQPATETSAAIVAAIRNSSDWVEVPIEKNLTNLEPLEIYEFRRTGAP